MARPLEKRGEVRHRGVPPFVLSPGQFAADQPAHFWHAVGQIIAWRAEIFLSEQAIDWSRQHAGHEAAVGVDPVRISRGDAVADETKPGCTKGDQLVLVHGQVGGSFLAELALIGGVFEVVSAHPVVFVASGDVFQEFAKDVAKQLDTARAGITPPATAAGRTPRISDTVRIASPPRDAQIYPEIYPV